MQIVRYRKEHKQEWDAFVEKSKNGTFLLMRDYMDYHSERFTDCSFMFYDEDRLVSLLPANMVGETHTLHSHQGLTYGGFIMNMTTKAQAPLAWMELLLQKMHELDLLHLRYKPTPHIYHRFPAEEDLYALFRYQAKLAVRNVSTVIPLKDQIASSRLRRAVIRAEKNNLTVRECDDATCFWHIIEEDRRERHNVKPVHTCEEINLLHTYFPERIRLFAVYKGEEILAGGVLFDTGRVTHLQYAAATHEGKELYATDILYFECIHTLFPDNLYFDYGTSNENNGQYLNVGMVSHKEEFGGRSIVYDTYEIDL